MIYSYRLNTSIYLILLYHLCIHIAGNSRAVLETQGKRGKYIYIRIVILYSNKHLLNFKIMNKNCLEYY